MVGLIRAKNAWFTAQNASKWSIGIVVATKYQISQSFVIHQCVCKIIHTRSLKRFCCRSSFWNNELGLPRTVEKATHVASATCRVAWRHNYLSLLLFDRKTVTASSISLLTLSSSFSNTELCLLEPWKMGTYATYPYLGYHKDRVRVTWRVMSLLHQRHLPVPSWIPTLPKLGSIIGFSQRLLWPFSPIAIKAKNNLLSSAHGHCRVFGAINSS